MIGTAPNYIDYEKRCEIYHMVCGSYLSSDAQLWRGRARAEKNLGPFIVAQDFFRRASVRIERDR
jgi:hypothetical protein